MAKAEPAHPALKWVRPLFLVGALFILAAAIVFRGIVPLEPQALWSIVLVTPGIGLVFFALTVAMAGRVLAAAMAVPEDQRPGWDDDEDGEEGVGEDR